MDTVPSTAKKLSLISLVVIRDLLSLVTLIAIILLMAALGEVDQKRANKAKNSNFIEVLDSTYYIEHAEKRSKLA